MTKEIRENIREMFNDGWSPEDIAEELGLDELDVLDYCADYLE